MQRYSEIQIPHTLFYKWNHADTFYRNCPDTNQIIKNEVSTLDLEAAENFFMTKTPNECAAVFMTPRESANPSGCAVEFEFIRKHAMGKI